MKMKTMMMTMMKMIWKTMMIQADQKALENQMKHQDRTRTKIKTTVKSIKPKKVCHPTPIIKQGPILMMGLVFFGEIGYQ